MRREAKPNPGMQRTALRAAADAEAVRWHGGGGKADRPTVLYRCCSRTWRACPQPERRGGDGFTGMIEGCIKHDKQNNIVRPARTLEAEKV